MGKTDRMTPAAAERIPTAVPNARQRRDGPEANSVAPAADPESPTARFGRTAEEMAPAQSPTASIAYPAFLLQLRDTLDEAYESIGVIRQEAVDLVQASIVRLARPGHCVDDTLRLELLAKYGELLARLEQLQNVLPRGREEALRSLDGVTALLRHLDENRLHT